MGMIQVCVNDASTMLSLHFCSVFIMLILCFYYVYHMLLLCFCYVVVAVFSCYYYVCTDFFNFFFFPFFKQVYVSKELFIEAMVRSKKKKRIEEVPHGIKLITWLTAVQESAFVLGKIETNKVTSPRARSRSIIQAKLLALEMKALPKNANVKLLLADTPKGERNRNLTEYQESNKCLSYGLSNCNKTFFVAKSWWGICPKDINGASNLLSVHWSSYFKGLYDQKQIPHAVMKMANNHLRLVFNYHQLKHDGRILPYFDYGGKKCLTSSRKVPM